MAGLWDKVTGWLATAPTDEDDAAAIALDAHHVLDRLGVGVEFLFVDVREPAEVASTGRLPDARLVPVGRVDAEAPGLPRDVVVVAYCASGLRAERAARRLRALGHPAAFWLEGGIAAWQRAGGEVEPA